MMLETHSKLMNLRAPLALAAAVLLLSTGVSAQNVVLPRGTDATLDVGTWNIEWFGSTTNGPNDVERQLRNTIDIMRHSGIDFWGLQEIADAGAFVRLRDSVATAGFTGQRSGSGGTQRLALMYNNNVIQAQQIGLILASQASAFASRAPMQLRGTVTLPDTTFQARFIVLHLKAFATQADYNTRVESIRLLKDFTDDLVAAGETVIVVGDWNDQLRHSIWAGAPSPMLPYLQDGRYRFATQGIDDAAGQGQLVGTFCGNSPNCNTTSTIDHILFSDGLFDHFVEGTGTRYQELLSTQFDNGLYVFTTSDHLPVTASFAFDSSVSGEPRPSGAQFNLVSYPNPLRTAGIVEFSLPEQSFVRLSVYDLLGREVAVIATGDLPGGDYTYDIDAGNLASGLYLVRLQAGEAAATRRISVVR